MFQGPAKIVFAFFSAYKGSIKTDGNGVVDSAADAANASCRPAAVEGVTVGALQQPSGVPLAQGPCPVAAGHQVPHSFPRDKRTRSGSLSASHPNSSFDRYHATQQPRSVRREGAALISGTLRSR